MSVPDCPSCGPGGALVETPGGVAPRVREVDRTVHGGKPIYACRECRQRVFPRLDVGVAVAEKAGLKTAHPASAQLLFGDA